MLSALTEVIRGLGTVRATPEDKSAVLRFLGNALKRPTESSGFVGSQPMTLHLDVLSDIAKAPDDYWVTWKADGARFLLCTSPRLGIHMIDRTNAVYKIPHQGDTQESLPAVILDTEVAILKGNNTLIMYVFDAIWVGRVPLRERTLPKRLGMVTTVLPALKAALPFSIVIKDYTTLDNIGHMLTDHSPGGDCEEGSVAADGLIFAPIIREYACFTDRYAFKWKPPAMNTIDFLLRAVPCDEGNPGHQCDISFCVADKDKIVPYGGTIRALVNWEEYEGGIYEAKWDRDARLWRLTQKRTDKKRPNTLDAAQGAWRAICDNITQEDLIARFCT